MSFFTSITPRFGGFYRVAALLFFLGLRLIRSPLLHAEYPGRVIPEDHALQCIGNVGVQHPSELIRKSVYGMVRSVQDLRGRRMLDKPGQRASRHFRVTQIEKQIRPCVGDIQKWRQSLAAASANMRIDELRVGKSRERIHQERGRRPAVDMA